MFTVSASAKKNRDILKIILVHIETAGVSRYVEQRKFAAYNCYFLRMLQSEHPRSNKLLIVAVKKCSIPINKLHYIDLLTGQRKQQAVKHRKKISFTTPEMNGFVFIFIRVVIVIVPLSGFEVWKSLGCN